LQRKEVKIHLTSLFLFVFYGVIGFNSITC